MGHWQDRLIYIRDFAYTYKRFRMASGNIGDAPASTFAELLSGPMIDIYVGRSKRHWSLHRNLLSHHSEFLASQLEPSHDSKRKPTDKLELPDHDPAGFELLVKWLYQGKLDDVSDMADPQQKYEYAVSCHQLYLICDHFEMHQLKNVAMDQYRKGLNEAQLVPDADEINEIYRRSPSGSPFRRLMTKIAARQIMDPDNERDVETYRECFNDNPDFAIDLVNAIRVGSGGILFDDPTVGDECAYHDHDAGPNCHIKGKGKTKQASKKTARKRSPKSTSSPPTSNSVTDPPANQEDHPSAPTSKTPTGSPKKDPGSPKKEPEIPPTEPTTTHRPPPPATPTRHPSNPARRPGDSAGPLRRRLTSPASSTVLTSTETATGTQTTPPKDQNVRFRIVSGEKQASSTTHQNRLQEEGSSPPRTVPNGRRLSSGDESRPPLDKSSNDKTVLGSSPESAKSGDSPARRGLWEWAKAGTGRLGIIGRKSQVDLKAPTAEELKKAKAPSGKDRVDTPLVEESQDDFNIPTAVATDAVDESTVEETAAAKVEGLGLANSTISTMFAETKTSSDDLFAASTDVSTFSTPERTFGPEDENSGSSTPTKSNDNETSGESAFFTPATTRKPSTNGESTSPAPSKASSHKNGGGSETETPRNGSPKKPPKLRVKGKRTKSKQKVDTVQNGTG